MYPCATTKENHMSTSDRVCPKHGDIGALPIHNNCPQCGAQLAMKGTLHVAGESIVHGAAVGFGVGLGLQAAEGIGNAVEGVGNAIGELLSGLSD